MAAWARALRERDKSITVANAITGLMMGYQDYRVKHECVQSIKHADVCACANQNPTPFPLPLSIVGEVPCKKSMAKVEIGYEAGAGKTLYDKLFEAHTVSTEPDGTALLYIDRHLVHEVTSPQAFEGEFH